MSNRPLSPHISIYRWPITMATSILHRATGIANSVGFIVLAAWLFDAAAGADAYAVFAAFMGSTIGKLLLIGWTFSFFFHFGNGIRHLIWDAGHGFEIVQANRSSWFVLILAVALTAACWAVLL
ncbi:MAG: succinate dehydrogenase, cytochrome b556 subunit [Gammaproteobacteria bacterium]|nr:succinate dehydrogenase, cytochrome b556 subunit [Gammaproteobacteria bacterium]